MKLSRFALISCLIFAGCDSLPIQYGAFFDLEKPQTLRPLESKEEAIAVLQNLNDAVTYWNLKAVQEVKITDYSVDISFDRRIKVTLPFVANAYNLNIFDSNGSIVTGSNTALASRIYHQSFLFSDINSVSLLQESFVCSRPDQTASAMPQYSYLCFVGIAGQVPFAAESQDEMHIQRLAAAFSMLSKVPTTTLTKYPNSGAVIAANTGQVLGLFAGSPLANSPLKIFDFVSSVDDATEQLPREAIKRLGNLTPGAHSMWIYPASSVSGSGDLAPRIDHGYYSYDRKKIDFIVPGEAPPELPEK